jgi:sterol desaturase/sphingolipid hydroxylase (fatty acid hydroxylase superfamily)
MPTLPFDSEPAIRLGAFVSVLLAMVAWERRSPRRTWTAPWTRRWTSNLGLAALNTLVLRALVPVSAVGVALSGERARSGLLHHVEAPALVELVLGLLVLDLAVYLQHVVLHAVPALWRLHRVHHADVDFDVTTGIRFHPIEIGLSMAFKCVVVLALGPSAATVVLFEILLNATSMFNHGNVRLPERVDRALRWVLVTPDMHRVHHSVVPAETDSNYGFNVPWWDRLFGTYRAQPAAGHEAMTIGLSTFREPRQMWLHHLLIQPFLNR